MNIEIKLNSRGNLNNRLVQVEGEPLKYQLKTDFNYRVGFKDNIDEITFIDPAGGPFISIGDDIEGHRVKSIHQNGIIEFDA